MAKIRPPIRKTPEGEALERKQYDRRMKVLLTLAKSLAGQAKVKVKVWKVESSPHYARVYLPPTDQYITVTRGGFSTYEVKSQRGVRFEVPSLRLSDLYQSMRGPVSAYVKALLAENQDVIDTLIELENDEWEALAAKLGYG